MNDGNTQPDVGFFPRVERFDIFEAPDGLESDLYCAIIAIDEDLYKVVGIWFDDDGRDPFTLPPLTGKRKPWRCGICTGAFGRIWWG